MINVNFEKYGTDKALLSMEMGGLLSDVADQIVMVIRNAERQSHPGMADDMLRRIKIQLETLKNFCEEDSVAEDFAMLNCIKKFDQEMEEREREDSEDDSTMTVKSESGSRMTVRQDGKVIHIEMVTKKED